MNTSILCGVNNADNTDEVKDGRSDWVDDCVAVNFGSSFFVRSKLTDAKDDSPVCIGMRNLIIHGDNRTRAGARSRGRAISRASAKEDTVLPKLRCTLSIF
jgi:hypothetical protein